MEIPTSIAAINWGLPALIFIFDVIECKLGLPESNFDIV